MRTYKEFDTSQYGIKLAKLIRNICHTHYDDKQDVMAVFDTDKQV